MPDKEDNVKTTLQMYTLRKGKVDSNTNLLNLTAEDVVGKKKSKVTIEFPFAFNLCSYLKRITH